MTLNLTPNYKDFINQFGSKKLVKLIGALTIIIIFTLDMGVPLNDLEKKIYNHKYFISSGVFATGYLVTEDINDAIFLFIFWYLMKYVLPDKKINENNNKDQKVN
tara:strand:- start:154 stop:468 length:315 start_codon:yes stop_codon:yes gene_type:complete